MRFWILQKKSVADLIVGPAETVYALDNITASGLSDNASFLFSKAEPLQDSQYLKFTTSNGNVEALFKPDFQTSFLSDKDFFNDVREVISRATLDYQNIQTASGKSIGVQFIGRGNEGYALRVDFENQIPLAIKFKKSNALFYVPPLQRALATETIARNPTMTWLRENGIYQNLEPLFALTTKDTTGITENGGRGFKYLNDMTINKYIEGETFGLLKYKEGIINTAIPDGNTSIVEVQNNILRQHFHGDLFIDIEGSNIKQTADGMLHNYDPFMSSFPMDDLTARNQVLPSSWINRR
jgi:hypothetical protein